MWYWAKMYMCIYIVQLISRLSTRDMVVVMFNTSPTRCKRPCMPLYDRDVIGLYA